MNFKIYYSSTTYHDLTNAQIPCALVSYKLNKIEDICDLVTVTDQLRILKYSRKVR